MENKDVSPQNEKALSTIRQTLNNLIKSQESGNWQLFNSCFAKNPDVVHIGTDIDEVWSGWKSFESWMKFVFQQKRNIKIIEKETKISISHEGTVAWFSQLTDTSLETKGEISRIEGFRHTGVLELIDNNWLIVQSHVSVPIINEIEPYILKRNKLSSEPIV